MTNYAYDKEFNKRLNGYKQNFRVITEDTSNPLILFVHGGPGAPDRHIAIHAQAKNLVEAGYTMVLWDQRGAGKSFHPSILLDKDLCIDDCVEDAHQLILWLCKKYHQKKIILFGRSWGTVLGGLVCKKYPELIASYIAQGQFVDGTLNEALSYEYARANAQVAGDKKSLKKLEGGAPVKGVYPTTTGMSTQRNILAKYGGADWKDRGGYFTHIVKPMLTNDGYHLKDIPKYAVGGVFLSTKLWPEVVSHDFRKEITELKMPCLFTIGRHDYNTPAPLALTWYQNLKAPYKKWVWFEDSAHGPISEEPEKWAKVVLEFLQEQL